MTSPFEFSRRPASHSPFTLTTTSKLSRPPIHNPYDKFSQPEFDAWIGGITGALRRALGQEDEVEEPPASSLLQQPDAYYSSDEEEVQRLIVEEDESSGEEVNDSFAVSNSRRVEKGKARDPRDGPGLGKGDENEPIVIGSDSEEEEEENENPLRGVEDKHHGNGREEWKEKEQREEETEEQSWGNGESSSQARMHHEQQQGGELEEDFDEEEHPDEEGGDEYEVQETTRAPSSILVLSSDESQDEGEVDGPPVDELDEEESGGDYFDNSGEASTSTFTAHPLSAVIRPPRYRAKEELDHQLSFPVLEVDEIGEDEDEDLQPLEADTSFPPHNVESSVPAAVEIRDPWSGPKTLAEDYYSGGDIRAGLDEVTVDRLGPNDKSCTPTDRVGHPENRDMFDVDDVDDGSPEEVQPLSEDTSFPPQVTINESIPSEYPIEIPDLWEGPRIYAEDYYAGGAVPSPPNGAFNPHRLGINDEGTTPTRNTPVPAAESQRHERSEVVDETPLDIEQPIIEDTSFPPNIGPAGSQTDYPIELPDPWEGPAKYAEDYYAGGDVRPVPGTDLSADRLGTGDDGNLPTVIDSDDGDVEETKKANAEIRSTTAAKVERNPKEVDNTQRSSIEAVEDIGATSRPPPETGELDFGVLYDDMGVEGFEEAANPQGKFTNIRHKISDLTFFLSVDLYNTDWDYATAFFDELPTEQLAAPEVTFSEDEQVESQDQIVETLEPAIDIDIIEIVSETTLEPSAEAVSDLIEEAASFVETGVASVEGASVIEAPDAPPLTQPQPSPILSTSHHQHDFGLPTPPSERNNDSTPLGNDDSINEIPDNTLATTVIEVDEFSAQAIDVFDEDVAVISEIEEFKEDGEGAQGSADGGVDFDTDALSEPPYDEAEGLTQDTVVELLSHEVLDEHVKTPVDLPTEELAMDSVETVQDGGKLVHPVEANSNAFFPITSNETLRAEEPTITVIDNTLASKSQPDSHPLSPREGISMPVCADPTVPDPTSRPRTPISQPTVLSPSPSSFMLSPNGTPGFGKPTTVLVSPAPEGMKALRKQHSQPEASTNGLFTPVPTAESCPATPESRIATPEATKQDIRADDHALDERSTEAKFPPDLPSEVPALLIPESPSTAQGEGIHGEVKQVPPEENERVPFLTAQNQPSGLVPSSSTPKLSLPHNAPSGPYSIQVVMRKATDPILFADPYPASLSTPDNLAYAAHKDGLDESLDEDTSQDNSISSLSTVENGAKDKGGETILDSLIHDEDVDKLESIELQYPSVQPIGYEVSSAVPPTGPEEGPGVTNVIHGDPGSDGLHEADADGDLDPDFVENAGKAREVTSPLVTPRQASEDKGKIPDINDHRAVTSRALKAPDKDEVRHSMTQQKSPRPSIVLDRTSGASSIPATSLGSSQSADELPSILIIKKPAVVQNSYADHDSEELTDLDEPSLSSAKPKPARVSKRKRSSPITTISPLTRSMTYEHADKKKAPSRPAAKPRGSGAKKTSSKSFSNKGKGKSKEVRALAASQSTFDTQSISSRSSSDASSALRLLHPSSRNTSRASSIVSNTPSDNSSVIVQPSPTLNKGSSFGHHIFSRSLPPPPLLHRHSHALSHHHHHHRPPPVQQPRHVTKASSSRPSDLPPTDSTVNRPSTSSQATSSHRTLVHSSSPVTRSNCRYHKISIPREENGPRIYFLVPGCSLGDKELMEEEEIEDLGDALPEDGRSMTHNLDAYQFEDYLIGVLRLLVGVDMLREQEVYYLPQSGENEVPSRVHVGSVSASPRRNSTASAISPVSTAGSASTSASAALPARRLDKTASSVMSFSESEPTEEEDSPRAKRHRPSPVEAKHTPHTLGDMGPPDLDTRSKKSNTRRSMRLGRDAAEYRPGAEGDGDSEGEDAQPERLRRSKSFKKGIKRSRTSDVREFDVEAHKLKKQRTLQGDRTM